MSAGIIATLILVGVGVLAAFAYVSQSIENAKQERRRQVLALQDRTRVGWNLITELPPTYLPDSLRQFILQYLTARYQEILTLDPKHHSAASQLTNITELQSQPYKSTLDSPEPIFGDLLTAKNTAGRVKDLVNFFVELHKDGNLDKAKAQQFINQGKALYVVIKSDIGQLTARQVEATGENAKLALVHYSNCRKQLEPFNSKGQMAQRIKFLDERIKDLRAKALEQEQAEKAAREEEKLEEEWNEYDKDGDWKIKHEYE